MLHQPEPRTALPLEERVYTRENSGCSKTPSTRTISRIGAMVFLSSLNFSRVLTRSSSGNAGSEARIDVAADENIGDVEPGEQEAREDRADQQFAERLLCDHRIDDRHHRRRDQDSERAAGEQRAAGELFVIAGLSMAGSAIMPMVLRSRRRRRPSRPAPCRRERWRQPVRPSPSRAIYRRRRTAPR